MVCNVGGGGTPGGTCLIREIIDAVITQRGENHRLHGDAARPFHLHSVCEEEEEKKARFSLSFMFISLSCVPNLGLISSPWLT